MTHGEIDESISTMQQFAEGFDSKPPEQQRLDQQTFVMAFTAGLLQEMPPNPTGYSESAAKYRFLANRELRAKTLELREQDPDLTMLEWLKQAVDMLEETYAELRDIDQIFKNESEIAHNVRTWTHTRPDLVDEGFASMAMRRAGLVEPRA